ncbi:hypothetical protein DL769_009540 [Monosporascus sp. CRB-8-3]|nr:hypothetical protein DL769_009540 [Monosporascus sp. CRB-8-3]
MGGGTQDLRRLVSGLASNVPAEVRVGSAKDGERNSGQSLGPSRGRRIRRPITGLPSGTGYRRARALGPSSNGLRLHAPAPERPGELPKVASGSPDEAVFKAGGPLSSLIKMVKI